MDEDAMILKRAGRSTFAMASVAKLRRGGRHGPVSSRAEAVAVGAEAEADEQEMFAVDSVDHHKIGFDEAVAITSMGAFERMRIECERQWRLIAEKINDGCFTSVLRKQVGRMAAALAVCFGMSMSSFGDVADGLETNRPAIDAHKPVTYHFAVTNTTDKPQMVESVKTSCACLKVAMGVRRDVDNAPCQDVTLPSGGVLPLDVVFNPAGMEGNVEKRVWVTLAPSKKIVVFDVAANVRLRLGFKPMDAAFGVIKRGETGREIVAKLSGYAADGATLGEPIIAAKNAKAAKSVFDVRIGAGGKSLVVKFREKDVLPGIYSETWTIPTSDPEIPEISFPVSARVAEAVAVTPQVITVGWDEPLCSRMVMVRDGNFSHKEHKVHKEGFQILSAETKPRKWGDVKITPRPLNGWRIDIENIDPREVRQFSKRPFLDVKTNLSGMESFEIPLRVVQNGGAE